MKYDAVIFDLDGTILATLDDLSDSLNFALKNNSLPIRAIDEVRSFVGNGIRNLILRAVPAGTDNIIIDKVHSDFTKHYSVHCSDKTKAYDGIYDLLGKLKKDGIKLAVLSNKADYAVQILCEQYFHGFFDAVQGEITGIPKKPSPEGVYAIIDKLGIPSQKCVYVGDSEVDITTANNSKLDCIIVDWGFRSRTTLTNAGANLIVSTPCELYEVIAQK